MCEIQQELGSKMQIDDKSFESATPHELGRIGTMMTENEASLKGLLDVRTQEDGIKSYDLFSTSRRKYSDLWKTKIQEATKDAKERRGLIYAPITLCSAIAAVCGAAIIFYLARSSMFNYDATSEIGVYATLTTVSVFGLLFSLWDSKRLFKTSADWRFDCIFDNSRPQTAFALSSEAIYVADHRDDDEQRRAFRINYADIQSANLIVVDENAPVVRVFDKTGHSYSVEMPEGPNGETPAELTDLINARVAHAKQSA